MFLLIYCLHINEKKTEVVLLRIRSLNKVNIVNLSGEKKVISIQTVKWFVPLLMLV